MDYREIERMTTTATRARELTGWQPIATAPENVEVLTRIDDSAGSRNEQSLRRKGRLWFYPDCSMYVYYAPTHWMPLKGPA